MRRGTIVILIFVLAAAGIVAASTLLQNQPAVTLTIAVDPLIEEWVRSSVNEFNATNPVVGAGRRVQFSTTTLEVVDDFRVWSGGVTWTSASHPDVWIASSSASVLWAQNRFSAVQVIEPSLAQTPLVWGGYSSRVNLLTNGAANPLDWDAVATAAADGGNWRELGGQAGWGFLKSAFSLPDQTMSGVAALMVAAAEYGNTAQVASAQFTNPSFRQWLTPVFETINFSTIGNDPAAFVARGTASADVAIAPESLWLQNLSGITRNEAIRLNYPEYTFVFDFPLTAWNDATVPDETRSAAARLGDWLMSAPQQAKLTQYGLRPINKMIDTTDTLFTQAEQYGIQPNPTFTNVLATPPLVDVQGLIRWFQSAR